MRDFLCKGVEEGHGTLLINGNIAGKPMHLGGLGLGNLRAHNKGLLAK